MPTFQETVSHYIGKTIKEISFKRSYWEDENEPDLKDDSLTLSFDDGKLILSDDEVLCCEKRYMSCDDDLNYHVGARLLGVELGEASKIEHPDLDDDVHEIQFLIIRTSLGVITVSTHNEHNGYYGGFAIAANHKGKIYTSYESHDE